MPHASKISVLVKSLFPRSSLRRKLLGRGSYMEFESRWTHFALEIQFDNGSCCTMGRELDGVHVDISGKNGRKDRAMIVTATFEQFPQTTIDDVLKFFYDQNRRSYSLTRNNCKHFVYDFTNEVLVDPFGSFLFFCHRHERAWLEEMNQKV